MPSHTPIIVQLEPTTQTHSMPAGSIVVGKQSCQVTCPNCGQVVFTRVNYVPGLLTWVLTEVLCLFWYLVKLFIINKHANISIFTYYFKL